jgi:electron-transferring-flavoprotein dehydrogenase
MKELWEVEPEKHKPGLVQHTQGWPLDGRAPAAARSSIIRQQPGRASASSCTSTTRTRTLALRGIPALQDASGDPRTFEGGKRISYGARAITEGGWQSVPKLVVPRRRADRLLGRLRQRAAHQGQRTTRCCPACWRPSVFRGDRRGPRQ